MSPAPDDRLAGLLPPGMTVDDVRVLARQVTIERAWRAAEKGDILEWGRLLFPDKFTVPFCAEMHGYFVQIAEEEFTVTEAPRGRAKTTIKCFLIPLFLALNKTERYDYFLNVQSTEEKALAVNRAIKVELEGNSLLREMYGDHVGPRWTDGELELKNGVVFKALGAGQSIRGLNFLNRRPRYIVVDDLYSTDDIHNQESTQKKNDWLMSELYPARAQFGRTSFHLQGTAINLWDLLYTLRAAPGVRHRTFRAVLDWDKKIVLWPELKSFDDMMKEKDIMLAQGMGSVIWFREYQNERHDDATSYVKRAWLYPEGGKSWEYDPADLRFDRAFLLQEVRLGCDPSIGDKSENDYTGIVLVYRARPADGTGSFFYVDALWNEHISLDHRVRLLESIQAGQPAERPITRAYIEGIAGFKDFVAEVRRRTSLPVREVDRVKDKLSTLESKSHFFENRQVLLNKNIDPRLKNMLTYQLTTNRPDHDDLRDALLLTLDSPSGSWAWA